MTRPLDEITADMRRANDGNNWTLGDLAAEVVTGYGEGKLQKAAADAGVAYNSLLQFRRVSEAYESWRRRQDLSWSVYREFVPLDDRHTLIQQHWTVKQARELVAERNKPKDPPPDKKDERNSKKEAEDKEKKGFKPARERRAAITIFVAHITARNAVCEVILSVQPGTIRRLATAPDTCRLRTA